MIAPLALLDPLFARAALVVEGNDILSWPRHIGDDKADAGNKLAGMPFDLGDHPARFRPASGLIGEARPGAAHLMERAAGWRFEQVSDPVLQDAVRRT